MMSINCEISHRENQTDQTLNHVNHSIEPLTPAHIDELFQPLNKYQLANQYSHLPIRLITHLKGRKREEFIYRMDQLACEFIEENNITNEFISGQKIYEPCDDDDDDQIAEKNNKLYPLEYYLLNEKACSITPIVKSYILKVFEITKLYRKYLHSLNKFTEEIIDNLLIRHIFYGISEYNISYTISVINETIGKSENERDTYLSTAYGARCRSWELIKYTADEPLIFNLLKEINTLQSNIETQIGRCDDIGIDVWSDDIIGFGFTDWSNPAVEILIHIYKINNWIISDDYIKKHFPSKAENKMHNSRYCFIQRSLIQN